MINNNVYKTELENCHVIADLIRNHRVAEFQNGRKIHPRSLLERARVKGFTLAEGASHGAVSNSHRKAAFTLAEVLITLGIIGVVAAMTLPTLINKYQEKVTVTKVKKFYSILSQGYQFAVQEYGEPEYWGMTGRDAGSSYEEEETYNAANAILIRNRLLKNLKKVQNCDNAKNQSACGMGDAYYQLNGVRNDEIMSSSAKTSSSLMVDGGAVMVIANPNGQSRGTGVLSKTYAIIYLDTNGPKPPNTYGKDLFMFYLTNKNIIPVGTENETWWTFNTCTIYGAGCTAWVIYNENMDYLKCTDLSWNGKKKCR